MVAVVLTQPETALEARPGQGVPGSLGALSWPSAAWLLWSADHAAVRDLQKPNPNPMNERFRDDARLVLTCIAEDFQEISGRLTYLLNDHELEGTPAGQWVNAEDRQDLDSIAARSSDLASRTTAA